MSRPDGDRGVAAVELALVLTLLLTLLALVVPLVFVFYERIQLGRAAGDVVRFASSRSDVDRSVPVSGAGAEAVVPADTLPDHTAAGVRDTSLGQVLGEAHRAYGGVGQLVTAVTTEKVETPDPQDPRYCPSTRRLTVTLTSTVDLGPFAGLLIPGDTNTLVARATSCEE